MGSELVSGSPPLDGGESVNGSSPVLYTDIFKKHLPYYLSIGMSYEQFWYKDCLLVKYYREAHEIKRRERNEELWLQGMYFYEALCRVAPILHAFAKKGTKADPYAKEPYPLTSREIKEREERDNKAQFAEQKAKMAAWAKRINMNMNNTPRKEEEHG